MAIGATMYTFDVSLADVDRGVYEDLSIRVAKHPSETEPYMVTRLLAYLLEHEEGITFAAGGVSSTDEPAVLVKDLSGRLTAWIEVGAPDAARLHTGSKAADRVAIYTHRDPQQLLASWSGKTIHRAETILLRSFSRELIDGMVSALSRRNTVTVSATEGTLFIEINGSSMTGLMNEVAIV